MASLKCLACGHDNQVGDESCTSCSSSLNLKLCSACEAINANSAERCHSCNAGFRAEPEVASPPELETLVDVVQVPEKALPATWLLAAQEATRRARRLTAALWLVPLLVAGMAYYTYAAYQPAPNPAPTRPQNADHKQAPAPALNIAPVPVARPAPAYEPKRTTGVITHTRAGVGEPLKTMPAVVPAARIAAPAAAPAVSEPARGIAERQLPPVTHTRAALSHAVPQALAAPAAAAAGTSAPEKRIEESTGCEPSVAALGLCKSK